MRWPWQRRQREPEVNGHAVHEREAAERRLAAARRRRAEVEAAADQFAAMIERALRGNPS